MTEGSEIWITDISGRTVYRVTATSFTHEVPVSTLAEGVYTLSVICDGQRQVSRFIKQ